MSVHIHSTQAKAQKDLVQLRKNKIETLTYQLLEAMGMGDMEEIASNPDIAETPRRFAAYMNEFSDKLGADQAPLKFTVFPADPNTFVKVEDLDVRSLCAHHLAPFIGSCTIEYVTGTTKAGLSKMQRVLDYFGATPQDQEGLTERVALYLCEQLKCIKVKVTMTCTHTCMSVRGVKNRHSQTTTYATYGYRDGKPVKYTIS